MTLPKPYAEWPALGALYCADCHDLASLLGPFDSVITDPPYHLTQNSRNGSPRQNDPTTPFGRTKLGSAGFMGKTWDGGDVAFRPETWARIAEACKPGAMLLAFGGTRTWHRLAIAIEEAGWEIRDTLMWLYGSGFPKSLDISKAIDKSAGAERETVGTREKRGAFGGVAYAQDKWTLAQANQPLELAVTRPATDAARLWSGWGTALKPAWEPIIVAMKPLDGTFAENAESHGVSGLNIDGCRIGTTDELRADAGGWLSQVRDGKPNSNAREGEASAEKRYTENGATKFAAKPWPRGVSPAGRFPSNLILDEESAALVDEQVGPQTTGRTPPRRFADKTRNPYGNFTGEENPTGLGGSSGNVSRFFYTAKASRSERGQTNTHPTVKPLALMRYLCRLTSTPRAGRVLDPFAGSGSTLIAAWHEGRDVLGIELDQEHCAIAKARIDRELLQSRLTFVEPLKEIQAELFAEGRLTGNSRPCGAVEVLRKE